MKPKEVKFWIELGKQQTLLKKYNEALESYQKAAEIARFLGKITLELGDYEYYITEKQIDNDQKGVAPFILAAIELNK